MGAVHSVRYRQEKQELNHWLSYAYVTKDRSWGNILYLIYLVIFFSVWWFVVLVFFAGGGAIILNILNPQNPRLAAVSLELFAFFIWFVIVGWRSLRRSPVMFSEEDAYLVCQMPLNPRTIVLRWLLMPWIKSLIPFAFFAITLGFSLAETTMIAGKMTIDRLFIYAWQGVQALLICIPLHLTLFVLIWAIGVWRMNAERQKRSLAVPLILFGLVCLFLLLGIDYSIGIKLAAPLGEWTGAAALFVKAGFRHEALSIALIIGWFVVSFSFLFLWILSSEFSPSWSAHETKETDKLRTLARYGFTHQVQEMRVKKRLGTRKKSIWAPVWVGPAAMIWKDLIQYWRAFSWGDFFNLTFFISSMLGFMYLPDISSRIFVIVFWAIETANVTTTRLRNDLSRWVIVKQLPLARHVWIPSDLIATSVLVCVTSLVGLLFGSILAGSFPPFEILLIPGMIASVAGMASFDIIRKARSDLLMRGISPGMSELTTIGGALCAGIPVLIATLMTGWVGILIAFVTSVLIAGGMLYLTIDAYRFIDQM